MRIVKTRKQGLLTRIFTTAQGNFLVVSVLQFFDFGRSHLLSEQELWETVTKELGKDAMFDMGLPKPRGEVLLAGKCFAPGGRPTKGCRIGLRIGPVAKELYVFGDRFWKTPRIISSIDERNEFTQMEIAYTFAFGGPGYKKNPLGKGVEPIVNDDGKTVHPLPNIEDPRNLIASSADRPDPAGFGPLDISLPQRIDKAGTYDEVWLREHFPGFAPDMDPTLFNAAPPDQWVEGFFQGNEAYELTNLHPEKQVIHGLLPGYIPRIFANLDLGQGESLSEIKSRLDTVWLFPNVEKGVLIFRGAHEIGSDEPEEVKHLMIGYEALMDAPLPFDHYKRQFEKRTDPKKGYLYVLRDEGLAPRTEVADQKSRDRSETRFIQGEGLQKQMAQKRAVYEYEQAGKIIESMGLNPDEYLPPPPSAAAPPDEELDPDQVDRTVEEAKDMAETEKIQAMAEAKQALADAGLDLDRIMAQAEETMPRFSARETIEALDEMGLSDPNLEERLTAAEQKIKAAYKKMAHKFPAPPSVEQDEAEILRQKVASRESIVGCDLAGIDLSGQDLKGMDFREALMERANLSKADLSGADLTGAVLARANLSGARLTGAGLAEANLGDADLTEADMTGADLTQAVLTGANLTDAILAEADLSHADLTDVIVSDTDLEKAVLVKVIFRDNDLSDFDFSGADVSGAVFLNPKLDRADFSGIKAVKTLFIQASGQNTNFHKADLKNACFTQNSKLPDADFSEANMEKTNLIGGDFTGARFINTAMNGANGMKAVFQNADLTGIIARKANFTKADFTSAKLIGADLMEAGLRKVNLNRADCRLANFFGADLMKVHVDGTNFKQANLAMTLLAQWAEDQV